MMRYRSLEQAISGRAAGRAVQQARWARASTLTPALEARILEWTSSVSRRTGRRSGARAGWNTAQGQSYDGGAVWAKTASSRSGSTAYMATNDPDFEQKAADIIGLYLNPPAHAAVFCVDEKTTIQALDRKDPVLPPRRDAPSATALSTSAGTLSLYAAFDTKTGEVLGKTAVRHTSAEFVAFWRTSLSTNRAAKRFT